MAFTGASAKELKELFAEAKEMLSDPYASFKLLTSSFHLTLPPRSLGNVQKGVLEQLNSRLRLYDERLKGMVVAYSNVRIQQPYGTVMTSQPDIHFNILAEFIVFQPDIGSMLKATVTKTGRTSIGCLVHACFNASFLIYPDDEGNRQEYEIGDEVLIEVLNVTTTRDGIVSIRAKPTGKKSKGTARGKKRTHVEMDSYDSGLDTPVIHPPSKKHRLDSHMMPRATSTPFTAPQHVSFAESSGDESVVVTKHKKKKHKVKEEPQDTSASFIAPEQESFGEDAVVVTKHKKGKHKVKEEPQDPDEEEASSEILDSSLVKHEKKKRKKRNTSERDDTLQDQEETTASFVDKSGKKKKKRDKDKNGDSFNLSSFLELDPSFDNATGSGKKKKHKKEKREEHQSDSMDQGVVSVEMSDSSGSHQTPDSGIVYVGEERKKKKRHKIKEEKM